MAMHKRLWTTMPKAMLETPPACETCFYYRGILCHAGLPGDWKEVKADDFCGHHSARLAARINDAARSELTTTRIAEMQSLERMAIATERVADLAEWMLKRDKNNDENEENDDGE